MTGKKFKSEYGIDYEEEVPNGGGILLKEIEMESLTFKVQKGYYGGASQYNKQVVIFSIEFTNGSSCSGGTFETNSPRWKQDVENRIRAIRNLNKDFCVKLVKMQTLQEKAAPYLRESSEIMKEMFSTIEEMP